MTRIEYRFRIGKQWSEWCDMKSMGTINIKQPYEAIQIRTVGEPVSTFQEMPRWDKCFIVFKGVPEVWYMHKDDELNERDVALREAETSAARQAEAEEGSYTYMCVPEVSVKHHALTAVYQGTVVHSTHELLQQED